MTPGSIRRKIGDRIAAYDQPFRSAVLEPWREAWVSPLLERLDLQIVPWETAMEQVVKADEQLGKEVDEFYAKCLRYCAAIKEEPSGA
jgi:hypothetical protein